MRKTPHLIAAVLLFATVLGLPAVHRLASSKSLPSPAPCHSHHPAAPSPEPVSNLCCRNAHLAAQPTAAFSLQLVMVAGLELPTFVGRSVSDSAVLPGQIDFPESPPGTIALRI